MTGPDRIREECSRARAVHHRVLDGDLLDASLRLDLEDHLSRCADCRGVAADLEAIQRALRAMPADGLPEPALDRVWDETVRAPRARAPQPRWGYVAAAAAALVVAALAGVWTYESRRASEAETLRAAAEARMVLAVTASALRRTEEATVRGVLAEEVSPALGRVPIRWPERRSADDAL